MLMPTRKVKPSLMPRSCTSASGFGGITGHLVAHEFALYTDPMSDERSQRAQSAANVYAPKPRSSRIMYGVVTVLTLALALWVVVAFYGLDLSRQPLALLLLAIPVFVGGLVLRAWRSRKHRQAFDIEIKRDHEV